MVMFQTTEKGRYLLRIETSFSRLLGCDLPILVAPMFLVSNVDMVVAAGEAGAVGSFPALNVRPVEKLQGWLQEIRRRSNKPYGVNLIVNRSNPYLQQQIEICLACQVPLFIASLGNPSQLIEKAHAAGSKVFCDVIGLEHARKAVSVGADGLIAVSSGAGGHAGAISPFALVPYLKQQFPQVPIVAAGSISDGRGMAAAFALGADGVSMGTRFIASSECPVVDEYKQAIVASSPEDIVLTYKMDGVAANVINTPYVQKIGTELGWLEKRLLRSSRLRHWLMGLRVLNSMPLLKNAVEKSTWKKLWGAGQGAGLVKDIKPTAELLERIVREYEAVRAHLPAGVEHKA
jgi:nitronate monooxygenase